MTEQASAQAETKLIPWWSYGLAVVFFFGIQALLYSLRGQEAHPKSLAFTAVWGLLCGMLLAFYMLMIGYVVRDSRRRGMNPVLWTFIMVSLLVTGVGFIVYFLLRQPIQMNCPKCAGSIQSSYNFCPSCQFQLNAICEHCRRAIHASDRYCTHCGSPVSERQQLMAVR